MMEFDDTGALEQFKEHLERSIRIYRLEMLCEQMSGATKRLCELKDFMDRCERYDRKVSHREIMNFLAIPPEDMAPMGKLISNLVR